MRSATESLAVKEPFVPHHWLSALPLVAIFLTCGCEDAFYEFAFTPRTKYSRHFDERAFARIEVGTSQADTLRFLGMPLREFQVEDITFYAYSDIGSYTKASERAYRQRWLAFDRDGRVIYIFRRTISGDYSASYPVADWKKGSDGVYRKVVREPFKEGLASADRRGLE